MHQRPESNASSISTQSIAQLQQLGIDVYIEKQKLAVANFAWLPDVLSLLNISKTQCLFDASTPTFDPKQNILHLPKTTELEETGFKRMLWTAIKPYAGY